MKKVNNGLAILSVLVAGLCFSACKKSGSSIAPPDPIGGFNTSNDVGGANLKAHWTFDGNLNESMSNTPPSSNAGASFVAGVKGQAVNFANGYALYPTIAALNTANLGSVTVSAWVKVDNNGSTVSDVFSLTQGTPNQTDWNTGVVTMYLETGHKTATDDTLVLHSAFSTYATGARLGGDNVNDYGVRETDFKTVHGTNKWVHYVMRYDGTTSNIDLFANGILVSNNNFRYRTTGTPPTGIGPIVTTLGTQALIGAFATAKTGFSKSPDQPWQGLFNGSIDELRFFTAALSDANISSLYQLELAGR
ncbi:MAG: hypothetical protein NVS1B13_08800 [Flavisolibacter sp.]